MTASADAESAIVMGRCPQCGAGGRIDLPAGTIRWASAELAIRAAGLEVPTCGCRATTRCPEMENGLPECLDWDCAGHPVTPMRFRYLKVTLAPAVKCGGRCAEARTSNCTCECAGRYHGTARPPIA